MHMEARGQDGFFFTVWFVEAPLRQAGQQGPLQWMFLILEQVQLSSLAFSLFLRF